jgi:large subunit ribosomal protein L15
MNLHTLKPAKGSVKKRKRIARGEGSGHGGTSTAGNKGAQSRAGYKSKRGHEGGQTPIQRRLPKRGFNNLSRIEYKVFNLGDLSHYATLLNITTFDATILRAHKLIGKDEKFKILSKGEVLTALTVHAHSFSAKAKAEIELKGGKTEIIK